MPDKPIPASVPPPQSLPRSTPEATERETARWLLGSTNITIEVGKAGRLARLGHNHIVHSAEVTGQLAINSEKQLIAELSVPVMSLTVDNPEQRAIHATRDPQRYASKPTAQQIEGTRKNMLGRRVLNAQSYTTIVAQASAPADQLLQELAHTEQTDELHQLPIKIRTEIAGHSADMRVQLTWQNKGDRLLWRSEFKVTHEQLGLTPFSALAGALSVAQELGISLAGEIDLTQAPEFLTEIKTTRRLNQAEET